VQATSLPGNRHRGALLKASRRTAPARIENRGRVAGIRTAGRVRAAMTDLPADEPAEPATTPVMALLGLGEAGGLMRAGLRAAGATVRGFDPLPETDPDAPSPEDAVRGAAVVLSLTTAAEARAAAESVLGVLEPGQVYADANTSSPGLKRELAALVEPTGAAVADVALMAPVPGRGLRTPALVAGPGAERFAAALGPLGMPVETAGAEPGAAARRKLLRSVAWKGVAAVAIEALAAARAAGCEDWMRAELVSLLEAADADALERMVSGSARHAGRRAHEMADVADYLRELGVEPRVSDAARRWLEQLRDAR
jgi:3-hydroxyisobutyrate dehydrogenase-like beta-hydroxyacid dehydrogenase